MLDEKGLRRDTFAAESRPIRLADGQEWYFPLPWVSLYPVVKDGRVQSMPSRTSFGPEFDQMVATVDDGGSDTIRASMDLAVFMLNRNYALPDSAYSELLEWKVGDEGSMEILGAIIRMAKGYDAPKPSTAGDGSPP